MAGYKDHPHWLLLCPACRKLLAVSDAGSDQQPAQITAYCRRCRGWVETQPQYVTAKPEPPLRQPA